MGHIFHSFPKCLHITTALATRASQEAMNIEGHAHKASESYLCRYSSNTFSPPIVDYWILKLLSTQIKFERWLVEKKNHFKILCFAFPLQGTQHGFTNKINSKQCATSKESHDNLPLTYMSLKLVIITNLSHWFKWCLVMTTFLKIQFIKTHMPT